MRARRGLLALLAIVALGAALRLWGIGFGLDRHDVARAILYNQIDEFAMLRSVLENFLHGNLHPKAFLAWGSGGFYLYGLLDALVLFPISLFAGGFSALRLRLEANPSDLILLHRLFVVAAALASIGLVARIGEKVGGRRVSLLAALVLATCYLHDRESHFGTVDVFAGLWTLLIVERCLALSSASSAGSYAILGLLLGLATATKYNGAALALPIALAHFAARPRPRFRLLALAAAVSVATWLALSPHVFFAYGDLKSVLDEQRATIGARLRFSDLAQVVGLHLRHSLLEGFGEGALPLAAIGGFLAWRRGGATRLLVLLTLATLPAFFFTRVAPVRYATPLVCFLSIFVAIVCARGGTLLMAALLLAAIAPSLVRSFYFDRLLSRPDTRVDVIDALKKAGARAEDVLAVGFRGLPRSSLASQPPPFIDWVMGALVSRDLNRDEALRRRPRFVLREVGSGLPAEISWEQEWSFVAPMVDAEYRVVLSVDGRPDGRNPPLPDLLSGTPAHLIPFASPWLMERPGPNLVLYERAR